MITNEPTYILRLKDPFVPVMELKKSEKVAESSNNVDKIDILKLISPTETADKIKPEKSVIYLSESPESAGSNTVSNEVISPTAETSAQSDQSKITTSFSSESTKFCCLKTSCIKTLYNYSAFKNFGPALKFGHF